MMMLMFRGTGERENVFTGIVEHRGDLLGTYPHAGDLVEVGVHMPGIGLGQNMCG